MNFRLLSINALIIFFSFTFGTFASAQESSELTDPDPDPDPVFVIAAGLKGGANINILSEPDEALLNFPVPALFGAGGGVGTSFDFLFWDIVGLNLEIFYSNTSGSGEVDFERGATLVETATSRDVSTSFLLKAQVPGRIAKPFLAVGLTLVHQLSASFTVESKDDNVTFDLDPIEDLARDYTMFTSALGVTFEVADNLRLPFELRFNYASQDVDPEHRLKFSSAGSNLTSLGVYANWEYQIWMLAGVQFAHGW